MLWLVYKMLYKWKICKKEKNSLPPTNAIKFQMHLQCSQNVQIVQYKLIFLEIFFLFHKSLYGSDHFRKWKYLLILEFLTICATSLKLHFLGDFRATPSKEYSNFSRYLKVIFVNLIVNQIQKVFPIFFVQTLKSTKKPTSFDVSNYPNFHETCKMTPLRCVQLKEIEAQQQWQNLDQPNENYQNLGRHQMFTFFRQTNFTKNFVKMIWRKKDTDTVFRRRKMYV